MSVPSATVGGFPTGMGPADAVMDDLSQNSTPPPDVAQSQIQPSFIWNGDRVVQQSTLPRSLTGLQSGQTPLPADAQANDFNGLSPSGVINHLNQLHGNEAVQISQQDASGEQALASQNQHLGGLVDRPADTTCHGQHVAVKSTAADLQTPTQDSIPGTSDSAFQDSTINGALPTINADADTHTENWGVNGTWHARHNRSNDMTATAQAC